MARTEPLTAEPAMIFSDAAGLSGKSIQSTLERGGISFSSVCRLYTCRVVHSKGDLLKSE